MGSQLDRFHVHQPAWELWVYVIGSGLALSWVLQCLLELWDRYAACNLFPRDLLCLLRRREINFSINKFFLHRNKLHMMHFSRQRTACKQALRNIFSHFHSCSWNATWASQSLFLGRVMTAWCCCLLSRCWICWIFLSGPGPTSTATTGQASVNKKLNENWQNNGHGRGTWLRLWLKYWNLTKRKLCKSAFLPELCRPWYLL